MNDDMEKSKDESVVPTQSTGMTTDTKATDTGMSSFAPPDPEREEYVVPPTTTNDNFGKKPSKKKKQLLLAVVLVLLLSLVTLCYYFYNQSQVNRTAADSAKSESAAATTTVVDLRAELAKAQADLKTAQTDTTPVSETDQIKALITSYWRALASVSDTATITISKTVTSGDFRKVSSGVTGQSGGGKAFVLEKLDDNWIVIWYGNDTIPQDTIDAYSIPSAIVSG